MKALAPLSALAFVWAASGALSAQQAKGDVELGFQGMYASTSVEDDYGNSDTTSTGMLQATFGVFATNHLEIGFSPMITIGPDTEVDMAAIEAGDYSSATNRGTKTTTGASIFATWSFLANGARVSPYAGMALYKQDFSDSEDKGAVGFTGGCKFYVAPKAAINVGANLMVGKRTYTTYDVQIPSGTLVEREENMTTSTLMFQVGFSYLF